MSLKTSPCTTVCRICLAIDVRTFSLSGTPLQSVFENLTSTALHTQDQRPVAACYICYHQLKKSYKLIHMSVKAENVLTNIFKRCKKITKQSISLVNRNANSLSGYLSISNLDYYDTAISEKSNDVVIEVKLEMEAEKDYNLNNTKTEMCESEGAADPLLSVTKHHATDIKEENPDDKTSVNIAETRIQEKSEQHLIPKASPSQRRYECSVCLKKYLNKYHLQRHFMVHSDEKPFKCRLCGSCFRTKYHLDKHLLAIHKETKDPYKCVMCRSEFKDRNEFIKHMRTHIYECDYCQKKISSRLVFINHMRSHVGEKFECSICLLSFTQKSSLSFHFKNKHKNEEPSKCEICNVNTSNLRLHSRIHKKNLKCNVCQQSFENYNLLMDHTRKEHTGENQFECNECHKRFSTKPFLIGHIRSHFKEKPHKCNYCTYASATSSKLKTHMRIHTGEKAFKCSVCQHRFRDKTVLTAHMRTHTGEKPFQCHLCEKRFINRSSMLKHISKNRCQQTMIMLTETLPK